jgi:hypothetical protein
MGIKSFGKMIEGCRVRYVSMKSLGLMGAKIAVDGPIFMYAELEKSCKEVIGSMKSPLDDEVDYEAIFDIIKGRLFKFLEDFGRYGIELIFTWDGASFPEKALVKKSRAEDRKKVSDRMLELKNELLSCHILARDKSKLEEYTKLLSRSCGFPPRIQERLHEFILSLSHSGQGFGAKSYFSADEAEKLCSSLVIEGKVWGVWSTDSDVHTFGGRVQIRKRGMWIEGEQCLEVLVTDDILEFLSMKSFSQFVDLCIMLGCDFNENVPGYSAAKCPNLIRKYNSLEGLREGTTLDLDCLNYERCREIFRTVETGVDLPQVGCTLWASFTRGDISLSELSH